MKLRIIETRESIYELPDNYFDQYDFDHEDCADNELAEHYSCGKRLYWEVTDIEVSHDTRVYNHENRCWEEVSNELWTM